MGNAQNNFSSLPETRAKANPHLRTANNDFELPTQRETPLKRIATPGGASATVSAKTAIASLF
jgi:hypothetical protein